MSGPLANVKHERFCQERIKGRTADEAYALAGYKPSRSAASRLSANVNVVARIAELTGKAAEKAAVTGEMVIRELARIGFSDVRRLLKWGGAPVLDEARSEDSGEVSISLANFVQLYDSGALDDDTAACISEISQTKDGLIKVKMADKLGALVALGKHFKLFTEKHEHTHSGVIGHVVETADEARANIARFLEAERARQGMAQLPAPSPSNRTH